MSVLPLLTRLAELEVSIRLADNQLKIKAPKGKLSPGLVDEIKDKKEEIIAFLQKSVQPRIADKSPGPAEEKEYYAVSSAQKRLYVMQRLEPESIVYNMPFVMGMEEDTAKGRLEKIFGMLIQRHESLRTSFPMIHDEPVQRVHRKVEFQIRCERVEAKTYRPQLLAEVTRDFVRSFDLVQAPLLRVGLLKTGQNNPGDILLVDMHHIISDGVSLEILMRDFTLLYLSAAAKNKLPQLRLQYKDFSVWQNSGKEGEASKKQEEYWSREFSGEIPVLSMPTDYPRPRLRSFAGHSIAFDISKEETEALNKIARSNDATSFMVLLAVYYLFLAKICSQENIVVGVPVAGRGHTGLEGIMGLFVNILALRNYPSGEKPFNDFLIELKTRTLEAFENQDYQFEDLVEKVVTERDMSRNPLFDAAFNLEFISVSTKAIPGPGTKTKTQKEGPSNTRNYPFEHRTAKFDLTLQMFDYGERLSFVFEYCTELFQQETILRFINYFKKITRSLAENPQREIARVEMLTGKEKRQLLYDFNDMAAQYPQDKTIHRLFAEQAGKRPDGVAVVGMAHGDPGGALIKGRRANFVPLEGKERFTGAGSGKDPIHITYKKLNEQSGQLAGVLNAKGVKPGTIVGIMAERSIEMIIGILGILKAGGAYLPIDPGYPEDRVRFMLADSGSAMLVTTPGLAGERTGGEGMVSLPDAINHIPTGTYLSNHSRHFSQLCYVIYTSGTTGNPKGVAVEHRNAVNTLLYRVENYRLNPDDTILQLFSFAFDGFVTSFFTAVLSGSVVVLLSQEQMKEIAKIKGLIVRHRVTHFISVPALFFEILKQLSEEEGNSLKVVTLAGDKLPPRLVELTRQKKPSWELAHEYGVTEAAVMNTLYRHQEKSGRVLIGKPIANTKIYVLNRYRHLQAIGLPGELYIAGMGVARGYLNRPELTFDKFNRDLKDYQDYHDGYPRSSRSYKPYIIYKTGDLGRWLPDGNIEFLGRIDFQVKIRGFRIELGEIENQLLKHPQIKEVKVVAAEKRMIGAGDEDPEKYLDAYIVPHSGGDPGVTAVPGSTPFTTAGLRTYLSQKLPEYMIPSHFNLLEKIPLTANGKIDRGALEFAGIKIETGSQYVAPGTDIERQVAGIWKEVLGADQVGMHDDFFHLGGTSLKVIRLNNKINRVMATNVPVVVMFEYRTVHSFVEYLTRQAPGAGEGEDRTEGMDSQSDQDEVEVRNRVKRRREDRKAKRRGY